MYKIPHLTQKLLLFVIFALTNAPFFENGVHTPVSVYSVPRNKCLMDTKFSRKGRLLQVNFDWKYWIFQMTFVK